MVRLLMNDLPVEDNIIYSKDHNRYNSIHVRWKAQKYGWVCLNVDGTCKNGLIGCGGAIRGSEGEWLSGFSKFIGRGDALLAELWGLVEGLKLARKLKFSKVEVRVNSMEVVEIVGRNHIVSVGRSIVQEIWRLLDLDWKVVLNHSYREANKLVDALAKYSFSIEDMCIIFSNCSDVFTHIQDADVRGSVTPRAVVM